MMKKISLMALPLLLLSGCSVEEIAQTAADAAACQALRGTLSGLQTAYDSGLVDSGILGTIDSLVGEQLDALLSSGLASDLRSLSSELGATDPAQSVSDRVATLTNSISARCATVEVNVE